MRHNKKGYYFSHRKMQFNELYLEKPFDRWHAWEHLLVNAEYVERDIQTKKGGVHLMPGQLLIGERDFAYEVGWTRSKVQAFFATLERTNMATTERTNKGTIVTIVNWGLYQKSPTNEPTNKPTNEPTSEQTLYKNYKNNKEGEEGGGYTSPTAPPSLDEIKAECRLQRYDAVDPEKFFSYYEGRNWRLGGEVINWKAMLRHWNLEDQKKQTKGEELDEDFWSSMKAKLERQKEERDESRRSTETNNSDD